MGSLSYPARGSSPIEIDDRVLAHLQVVIGSKLRQRQSFFLSWVEDLAKGSGRVSIWIDPDIQLMFTYETCARHRINRPWLESMMASANSANGLLMGVEPRELALAVTPDEPDVIAA
jgi:hypothetical protein